MPLARGEIIGHDTKRLTFTFTMLNDGVVVACQISDAALDQLAGMKGTESFARQAQLLSLRGRVEGIASRVFDKEPRVTGQVVRIFTKHLATSASLTRRVIAPAPKNLIAGTLVPGLTSLARVVPDQRRIPKLTAPHHHAPAPVERPQPGGSAGVPFWARDW